MALYVAAVFFECFHHCDDHRRLLRALHRAVQPGGCVVFAAEPIAPDYPVPWGVRMDGEALWAIHNFGWLELGFRDDYLRLVSKPVWVDAFALGPNPVPGDHGSRLAGRGEENDVD